MKKTLLQRSAEIFFRRRKRNETKVVEEYCWATEQVAECTCHGQADSCVFGSTNSAELPYVCSNVTDRMYT
jgi:hypothetical protein